MFAIVEIGGKQYKIFPGASIEVEKIAGKVGDTVFFNKVLLASDEKGTKIGMPRISGVKVTGKIIAQTKANKIDILRFKSKVRYRRKMGFRPLVTKLEIVAIGRT